MTHYYAAVETIRQAYALGERRIEVSPEVFAGYESGLIANTRRVEAIVTPDVRWLLFKDAKVRVRPCE